MTPTQSIRKCSSTTALPADAPSFRQAHRPSQHGSREPLRRRGLAEEESLYLVEAHLAHGEKIRLGFDPLGDGARAIAVGEVENAVAHRLLQAIGRAAGDELSVDLDLGEGKVVEPGELGPFRAEIVDGDGDVVEPKLP